MRKILTVLLSLLVLALVVLAVMVGIYFFPPVRQCVRGGLTGRYFVQRNMTFSLMAFRHRWNNSPDKQAEENMLMLIDNVLNPARKELGAYIRISSGYRSEQLNRAIGGVKTSQHRKGQAADLICLTPENTHELYEQLKKTRNYDQLLFETRENGRPWVHVSWKKSGNRCQAIDNYKAK